MFRASAVELIVSIFFGQPLSSTLDPACHKRTRMAVATFHSIGVRSATGWDGARRPALQLRRRNEIAIRHKPRIAKIKVIRQEKFVSEIQSEFTVAIDIILPPAIRPISVTGEGACPATRSERLLDLFAVCQHYC